MHRVAVVGASGYTGAELLRLLAQHPLVELTCITSRQYSGQLVQEIFPSLAGCIDLIFEDVKPEVVAQKADLVFTAVPHQAAMTIVPDLLANGCRVIDLSADFRIRKVSIYEKWYQKHSASFLLDDAVYGLPELFREMIPSAQLVANPGCYPTSIALALAPLLEKHLIDLDTIICDSKSGASGAGRSAKLGTLYCEINEGFKAYGLPRHRHTPEIEQTLSNIAAETITVSFTPHLLPINRGILSTCYATLIDPLGLDDVMKIYHDKYASEDFIRVFGQNYLPNVNQVAGTNFCDIGLVIDERTSRVIVVSVIDNLIKGAAGQAIQNMNIMFGLPETTGLKLISSIP